MPGHFSLSHRGCQFKFRSARQRVAALKIHIGAQIRDTYCWRPDGLDAQMISRRLKEQVEYYELSNLSTILSGILRPDVATSIIHAALEMDGRYKY